MGTEENKKIAIEFIERLAKGDNSVIDELLADDCTAHTYMGGYQTTSGKIVKEGLKQANDIGHVAWPDYSMTIEDVMAQEDKVFLRATRRGTHLGQFVRVPPTNKSIEVSRWMVMRLKEGKVTEAWTIEDSMGMYQQMGVLPSSAEFTQAYKDSLE